MKEINELLSASRLGDTKEILKLLKNGTNVNVRNSSGFTPLSRAIVNNKYDAVRILMDHGADVNLVYQKKYNALHIATNYSEIDPRIIEIIITKIKDINEIDRPHGNTALWYACHSGYPNGYRIAEFLLQNGAKIDTKNIYGKTVLDMANQRDDIPEFKKMLEKYHNERY